jgi:uncharacterized protein YhaN
MSSIDTQEDVLSEDAVGQGESDGLKLVPVGESIRYRKRAQSAEKKVEALNQQLSEARAEAAETAEQLKCMRLEQELTRKLAAAGTVDLETAVLIAKAGMEGRASADMDGVVGQMRKDKQYLFSNRAGMTAATKRTAPAKDRIQDGRTILERAAKKAATTGNRTDLQEYLKLRRDFV